jgi:hypothetical protein
VIGEIKVTIVENVAAANSAFEALLQIIPGGELSESEWESWVASRQHETLARMRSVTSSLIQLVRKHSFVPTGLASNRGTAVHKLHNMLHAMHLETGSWGGVLELCSQISGIVTDRGAERLLESTPQTLMELSQLSFLPRLGERLHSSTKPPGPSAAVGAVPSAAATESGPPVPTPEPRPPAGIAESGLPAPTLVRAARSKSG